MDILLSNKTNIRKDPKSDQPAEAECKYTSKQAQLLIETSIPIIHHHHLDVPLHGYHNILEQKKKGIVKGKIETAERLESKNSNQK